MKILHLAQGLRSGGVAQVIYDLASDQVARGSEVEVVSIHSPHYNDEPKRFEKAGIKVTSLHINSRFDLGVVKRLASLMKNFDLVHVHLFPNQLYAALALLMIPQKERPAIVTTEHNTWNNRRAHPFLRRIDRWFYKKYDKIVAISPEADKALREWLNTTDLESKIITINNGVDISKFQKSENHLSEICNIPATAKTIVMVCRMERPKVPETILRSAVLIPGLHVVLIGDGPLMDSLKSISRELGIEQRTHFLGNRRDVENIIKGCTIGCLSTEWDGFGLVAVEYMAAGLPVLVSDVPGLREVVGDKEALFSTYDEKALEDKIRKLLEDSEYYQSKVDYSLMRCHEYALSKTTDSYWNLYQYLIESQKG